MSDLNGRRKKYKKVAERLSALYGFPTWRQDLSPVAELVNCILSQSTSDVNRDKGYEALIRRYPTWEAVRDAPESEVIETIRPAGLAHQKGPRIQNALRYISESCGSITLDFLAAMSVEDAKVWLTKITGIGPKTAAVVLLFAFNKPAFPVDTHVHRVSQRLGLIGPKTTAEQAHPEMESIVPAETYYQAHINIIQHGREICQSRKPTCEICPLTDLCDYYQSTR